MYMLNRRLGKPQTRCDTCGEILPLPRFENNFPCRPASYPLATRRGINKGIIPKAGVASTVIIVGKI